MKNFSFLACSVLIVIFNIAASARTADHPADWVEEAVSADQSVAQKAQDQLRQIGPQGLELLEQRFANEISAHQSGMPSDERWKRIAAALDRVGGQYDDYASGLYWYTDLEKAKAAARTSGRPILSLRLLGRLDEDLSCANSRFFRTTLYPSAEINQLLKNGFILHWESVRPAPRVTIDFGDGRTLQRTITGNSIHYILDSDGKIVDALPGLYSAPVFTAELQQAAAVVKEARGKGTADYAEHMNVTCARLLQAWAADLAAINAPQPPSKALAESALERWMDDNKWQQVAQLHVNVAAFDGSVRELMARKFPSAPVAARVAMSKAAVETPMIRALGGSAQDPVQPQEYPDARVAAPVAVAKMAAETPMMRAVRNLSGTVALDTVQNNYMRRTKILAFLAGQGHAYSLAQANDWIYARIFLTPRQDPWLGLAPADVFAAIDGNGETRELGSLSATR